MINRRKFLGGLGFGAGAAMLMPFFREAVAGAAAPRRFVIVVEGNSVAPVAFMSPATRAAIDAQATGSTVGSRWFPRLYGHSSPLLIQANDLGLARALDPLVGGAGELDLTSQSAVALGLSSTVTGGGHSTHFGALSCSRSSPQRPGGQTIDALLAELPAVRQQTPFDALRVGIEASSNRLAHATCATGPGRSIPVIVDPLLAYNNAFGSAAPSGQSSFQKRGELLDFAREDVNSALAQFSGNSVERAKLERYLESIEAIDLRQQRLVGMQAALSANLPEDPSTNPLFASTDPLDGLRAQFEIATAALLGGLTHVVVITSGTGSGFDLHYDSIISGIGRHDLHHQSGGNPAYVEAIYDVTRAHVEMVATMARALAGTAEVNGSGTMLDHTAILYTSDNGEQHHSTAEEWPCLLVGGQALGMRTDGRTVVYPGERDTTANRQMSNLFNTLGYAAGTTLDDFGNEGVNRIATGPLFELFA